MTRQDLEQQRAQLLAIPLPDERVVAGLQAFNDAMSRVPPPPPVPTQPVHFSTGTNT